MKVYKTPPQHILICRRDDGDYELAYEGTEWLDSDYGFNLAGRIAVFCPKEFHACTNVRMRKGEKPKKIKITFSEV